MRFKQIGEIFPAVEVYFDQVDESIYTQSGGMSWMSDGVEMNSNMRGGLSRSIGRLFTGELLFMVTYVAKKPNAMVAISSSVPGQILEVNLTGQGMIAQKDAFLFAEQSVELKTVFTKRFSAGLFGGEGFILQDLSGAGKVFFEIDGMKVEKNLAAGEVLKVDSGNVVAFDKSVSYEIETIKGVKNILFGGEGLFVTRLVGPGKVILQTQNFNDLARRIISLIPSKGH